MMDARPGRLGRRAGLRVLVALMMLTASTGFATAVVPMGLNMGGVREATNLGAQPSLGTYWVGAWTAGNWAGLDDALKTAKATGVTPVLHWYYWGDGISPWCVENGCDGKSRAQWADMTRAIGERIRQHMGGSTVVVVLENEFNKGGITDSWYAPTFDGHLEARAKELKATPGVKVVLGFGAWGESAWSKFPKAAAQSDYIGFQMMRASTRDSEASYRGAADSVRHFTSFIASTFNKPSFLYDLALSSYSGSYWERVQAETLDAVLDQVVESGSTGLQGVAYRSLRDTYMDPKNYFGHAESHWGLLRQDGSHKPAWSVWKAKVESSPPPSTGLTFTHRGGHEYWVKVLLDGTDSARVTKVEARDTGGHWVTLNKQWWGDWAASFRIEAGHLVQFRATLNDGRVVDSCEFTHPAGEARCAPDVRFLPKGGNEWWVSVHVWGTDAAKIAKVESRDSYGQWVTLPLHHWGDHAASYRVEPGNLVYFRATLHDGRVVESCGYKHPTPGDACAPDQPATFSPIFATPNGNEWWLQTKVSGAGIASVDVRINGGAWKPLVFRSWGAWAESYHAPSGSVVEFRANDAAGASVVSQKYAWPPK